MMSYEKRLYDQMSLFEEILKMGATAIYKIPI